VISLSIISFGYRDRGSKLQVVECIVGSKLLFNFPDTLFGNIEPLKITERNIGVCKNCLLCSSPSIFL
jgi:hypothetical protein